MENIGKRLLSLAVALVMIISMVPGNIFQVYAAENESTIEETPEQDTSAVELPTGIEWITISSADELVSYFGSEGTWTTSTETGMTGYFKLAENTDLTLEETLYINKGHNVVIDLNGNDLSMAETVYRRVFYVSGDATLTLLNGTINAIGYSLAADSKDTVSGGIFYVTGANLVLNDVEVTKDDTPAGRKVGLGAVLYGLNANIKILGDQTVLTGASEASPWSSGGVMYVQNSIIEMHGGTIRNGHATSYSGNVHLRQEDDGVCEFHLYDGTVTDGVSSGASGGNFSVRNESQLHIYGESVVENGVATSGGNIATGNTARVYIYGGTIQDGQATYSGGNIYISGANEDGTRGAKLYMYDGLVTQTDADNTKKHATYGGNIFLGDTAIEVGDKNVKAYYGNDAYLYGGTISGGNATYGGNIYAAYGKVQSWDVEIEDGMALKGLGGNVYLEDSPMDIYGTTISDGISEIHPASDTGTTTTAISATAAGGAGNLLATGEETIIKMWGGQISGGKAEGCGGNIILADYAELYMYDATIKDGKVNKDGTGKGAANYQGGNILMFYSKLYMHGGKIGAATYAAKTTPNASVIGNVMLRNASTVVMYGGTLATGTSGVVRKSDTTTLKNTVKAYVNADLVYSSASNETCASHDGDAVTTVEATCSAAGYTEYTCATCEQTWKANIVAPTMCANATAEVTAPTCMEWGYTTYTCTCGKTWVDDLVAPVAANHTYGEGTVAVAATCETDGVRLFVCENPGCVEAYTETINKLGHDYGEWLAVDGTDTHQRVCKRDETHVETETHGWETVTTYPTLEQPGVKTTVTSCKTCGAEETETGADIVDDTGIAMSIDGAYSSGRITAGQRGIYFRIQLQNMDKVADTYFLLELWQNGQKLCTVVRSGDMPTNTSSYPVYVELGVGNHNNWNTTWEEGIEPSADAVNPDTIVVYYQDSENIHQVVSLAGNTAWQDNTIWAHEYVTEYKQPAIDRWGNQTWSLDWYKVSDADCENGPTYYQYCKHCGKVNKNATFTYGDALNHAWSDWESISDTQHQRTCGRDAEHVETQNHIFGDWVDGVHTCTVCSKEVACTHAWDKGVINPEPTCNDAGTITYTCTICKDTKKEVANATGHTESAKFTVENEVAGTCQTAATWNEVYRCETCGEVTRTESKTGEQDLNNHTNVVTDLAKAPTCEATGLNEGKHCEDCGVVTVEQTVRPALGHNYTSEVTKAATCEEDGVRTYTCQNDKTHTYTEAIEAIGHKWDEGKVTTAPTCEEDGVRTYTCQNDNSHTSTEAIGKLGHDYEGVVTAPTCEAEGYTTYTCKRDNCDDSYVDDKVAALGHKYVGAETKAPTCEAAGVMTYTCENDASHTYTEEIAAIDHAYTSEVTTAPTCESEGVRTYTCQNDKTHTYTETIEAIGHDWDEGVYTDPTYTADGYTTYTCQNDKSHTKVEIDEGSKKPAVEVEVPNQIEGVEDETADEVREIIEDIVVNSNQINKVDNLEEGHYLKIEVAGVKVVNSGNAKSLVTRMTFDVTPMVGDQALDTLTKEITFRLPVHKDVVAQYAAVFHDGTLLGAQYTIYTDAETGEKYVEITSKNFSLYEVVTDYAPVAQVGETTYETFDDAFAAADKANATITLLENIELSKNYTVSGNITLDLNGKAITADFTDNGLGVFYVRKGAVLTVTGNGSITATGSVITTYGTVNIEGGTIATTKAGTGNATALYVCYYAGYGEGTAVISGGSVNEVWNCGTLTVSGGKIAFLDTSSELTVSGGEITEIYARDGSDASGEYVINITDPEAITVPNGFKLDEVSEGVYKVVAKTYVAQVGETDYETLQAAVDAANAGETVTVLTDVELTEALVIAEGKNIVLDLAGKTVSGTTTEKLTKNDALIRITKGGELTVTDSVGEGQIVYAYTGEATGYSGYSASTIENNQGTLTVKSGTIISNTTVSPQIAYTINSLTNGGIGDATTTIEGGKVIAAGSTAVRQFANSTTCTNTLNITGGDITGRVQLQSSNKNDNKGVMNITGGTITREGKTAIEVWFAGGTGSAFAATDVNIGGNVAVKGNVVIDSAPTDYDTGIISGGTFDSPVSEELCAEGFVPQENEDGTFGVRPGVYLATVNGVKYESLAEAVAAAGEGETVTLLTSVELTETLVIAADKNIVLELNGNTISGVSSEAAASAVIDNAGTLTVQDSVGGGKITSKALNPDTDWGEGAEKEYPTYANNTIKNSGNFILKSGVIENTTEGRGAIYAIDSYPGGNVTIEGGKVVSENTIAIRFFPHTAGKTQTLTVTGGEISGTRGIMIQNTSGADVDVNISGGTITGTGETNYRMAMYVKTDGSREQTDITISGGTIDGDIMLGGGQSINSTTSENVSITGGTFKFDTYGLYSYCSEELIQQEVNVSGGTFNMALEDAYLAENFEQAKVGNSFCVGTLPNATVNDMGKTTVTEYSIYNGSSIVAGGSTPIDLQIALEFIANDTAEEAAQNVFGNYTTDFYITMTGIENGSFTANGCYLAGNYGTFGWVMIPLDGFVVENNKVYPVISSVGLDFKYVDICDDVQNFKCGIYMTPEILKANPNLKVQLDLGLSEDLEAAQDASFTPVEKAKVYNVVELIGGVAEVGGVGYETLQAAINAAEEGDTVTLLTDVTETSAIVIDKSITLDGNGNKLNTTASRAINVDTKNGTVTTVIKNLEIVGGAGCQRGINIIDSNYANTPANVTLSGVKISGVTYYGVQLASSVGSNNTITVTDSEISSWIALNINGDSQTVTVNNSKLSGTAYSAADKGNTITVSGENTTVTMNGGVLSAATAEGLADHYCGHVVGSTSDIVLNNVETNVAKEGDPVITYAVAKILGKDGSFLTVAGAIKIAEAGDTVVILRDVTVDEMLKIEKNITVDLDGNTITGTAKKVFEIHANATIKNGAIINTNTQTGARCVNTRVGDITVNLENLDMTVTAPNAHGINLGGAAGNVVLNVTDCSVNAGESGYAVLNYNDNTINITDSQLTGYAALYMKGADGSEGSNGSVVTLTDTDLIGVGGKNENFGVIVLEDNGVTVNADAASTISAPGEQAGTYAAVKQKNTAGTVVFAGTIKDVNYILTGYSEGTTFAVQAQYADELKAAGYFTEDYTQSGLIQISEKAVAYNASTDTLYNDLEEAIADAASGETVKLMADVTVDEVIIRRGRTLDLNGYTLSVEFFTSAFKTANVIDSSDGEGLLKGAYEELAIYKDNAYMAVWDETAGGYRFTVVRLATAVQDQGEGAYNFVVQMWEPMTFDSYLAEAILDGTAADQIQFRVHVEWDGEDGTRVDQTFRFSDSLVNSYCSYWAAGTKKSMIMSISGAEGLTNITFTAQIVLVDAEGEAVVTYNSSTKNAAGQNVG